MATLLVNAVLLPVTCKLLVTFKLAATLTVPPRKVVPAAIVLAAKIPISCELPETLAPLAVLFAVSACVVIVSAIRLVIPIHVANESVDITTLDIGCLLYWSCHLYFR